MAAGVLEYHRPHGHPHIFRRHGPASPGATSNELRAGHLLRQYHLLVHPAARNIWSQQVPGSLCDDDWQDGEKRQGMYVTVFLQYRSYIFSPLYSTYIWLFEPSDFTQHDLY